MFKKHLFCMLYFVEYEIDVSFYFHNFFFGFKLWPPIDLNLGFVPDYQVDPTLIRLGINCRYCNLFNTTKFGQLNKVNSNFCQNK